MTGDDEEVLEDGEGDGFISKEFVVFLFLGLTLVVVGIVVVLAATAFGGGSASFGGVIFIGLFPIVIGLGPDWNWLVAIGIALAALGFAMFVIMRRRI